MSFAASWETANQGVVNLSKSPLKSPFKSIPDLARMTISAPTSPHQTARQTPPFKALRRICVPAIDIISCDDVIHRELLIFLYSTQLAVVVMTAFVLYATVRLGLYRVFRERSRPRCGPGSFIFTKLLIVGITPLPTSKIRNPLPLRVTIKAVGNKADQLLLRALSLIYEPRENRVEWRQAYAPYQPPSGKLGTVGESFCALENGERPSAKHGLDPKPKSPRQFCRVFPVDAIVLPDIKMQILDLILSTGPNNLPCQTDRKSRFEIDVLPMAREVRHQERRASNFGDDLVIDLVGMFLSE
jgi:hypothetical protein